MQDTDKDPVIFILSGVLTGALCMFGFVGNIITLIALIKDKRRNANICLLAALAIADWLMLASIFNGVVIVEFCAYIQYDSPYIVYLENTPLALIVFWVIGCVVQTNTIWLVVAVTWDRFLAVCSPFQSIKGKSNSIKRARNMIIGVFLFSVAFNLPKAFHFCPIAVNKVEESNGLDESLVCSSQNSSDMQNDTVPTIAGSQCNYTPAVLDKSNSTAFQNNTYLSAANQTTAYTTVKLYENELYHYIYYIGVSWLVSYIVPLLSLLILNIVLLREIRIAQRNRATLLGSRTKEGESLSVTVNIIAMVTSFLICQAPDFSHTLISYPPLGFGQETKDYSKAVAYASLACNSSINFIIYSMFYKRFRRTVIRMCGGCCFSNTLEEHAMSTVRTKNNSFASHSYTQDKKSVFRSQRRE